MCLSMPPTILCSLSFQTETCTRSAPFHANGQDTSIGRRPHIVYFSNSLGPFGKAPLPCNGTRHNNLNSAPVNRSSLQSARLINLMCSRLAGMN